MSRYRVDIDGAYGDTDGSIHIMDGDTEMVMWDGQEWADDPSLVFVIANAILMSQTEPTRFRLVCENRPS